MSAAAPRRERRRLDVVQTAHHPAYVVWELTLRCDHACHHCGSRAGVARPDELTTAQALDVVAQLRAMGTREVVLIGGEAYLHEGFLDIVRALKAGDMNPTMTTGGRGIDDALAVAMKAAGIDRVSVSIDGLEAAHDRMRNLRGSFASAMSAIAALRRAGIPPLSNINLNRSNHRDLEALYEVLRDAGVRAWQVQITTPLGRAADRTDMILQPWDLIDIVPRLAAIKRRAMTEGVEILLGNNLGYFGPEEALLRSPSDAQGADHWRGCQAGKFVMGIEADGAVKGCPSLQTTSYVGGRLGGRAGDRSLRDIWENTPELGFARARTVEDLWGFCRTCAFAEVCLGGCTFTAHAVLGRPGNNPYCHYRARTLAKRGERERLVPAQAAPGTPFDNGTFDIVVEPLDAPDEPAARPLEQLVQLTVSRRRVIP